ncbi:MAG TPA: hypothetical protein VKY92_21140 [Verrucomicrobiae bacterium]|nr:hypothetical protein [Verrucomicrobiae bacterium]
MRIKFAKIVGPAVALLAFGSVCFIGVRAQQPTGNSRSSTVTTNWVGHLVTGQTDAFDRMTPSPSPTIIHQAEIGLRSDGLVVWRETPKTQ